jgi:hypothetical protein
VDLNKHFDTLRFLPPVWASLGVKRFLNFVLRNVFGAHCLVVDQNLSSNPAAAVLATVYRAL